MGQHATATRRSERTADRPSRDREPEVVRPGRAESARGHHDVAALPVPQAREVSLWRGAAQPAAPAPPPGHRDAEALEREARQTVGADRTAAARGVEPTARARRAPCPDRRLGAGRALSAGERQRSGSTLGMDLADVRVHEGPAAEAAAADRHAHAFTYGNHVVLGRAPQRGGPVARTAILTHELTHVRQQSVGIHPARGPPAGAGGATFAAAPLAVQCWDAADLVPGFVTSAAETVSEVGSSALESASELGGAVVDLALESAASVIETLAPGLLDFVRGGALTQIAELLCTGLSGLVEGYFAALADVDVMTAIEQTFSGLAAGVGEIQESLSGAASATVGIFLRPLVEALQEFGGPLVETIQSISDTVNGLFTGLWDSFGVPVLDFLGTVGGAVYGAFNAFVTWIWDLTEPIRDGASTAWNWLLDTFDLAWRSTGGVRTWLGELAASAWETLQETVEPVRGPLTAAAGVLLLVSPLGPVIVLTQVLPPVWEALTWLWENWNSEDILVRAQDVLRDDVLPGLIGAVSGATTAMADAAAWLAGVVAGFGAAMGDVLATFGAATCLTAVLTHLNGVADQFNRMAAWAESGFAGLTEAVTAVFDALVAWFQPILDFLVRLLIVSLNPPMLPIAIAASIWLLCPEDLKPPVINFVLDLLLAFISGLSGLFLVAAGPLAAVLTSGVLGFLRHLRSGEGVDDKVRIQAADKVAALAAGGGIAFIAGLAFGVLHGVIDGIIDPFRLIFLIARVVILAAQAIGRVVQALTEVAVPEVTAIGTATRSALGVPPAGTAEARAPPGPTAAVEAPAAETAALLSAESTTSPVATASATVAAEAAGEGEAVLDLSPSEVTDAEVAAALSTGMLADASAATVEPAPEDAALEDEMRGETESEGASVGGLAQLLGDAWNAMLAGAEGLGARAAAALLEFLQMSDFDLGLKLGFVIGFVLFQALIAYLTAGGYTTVAATAPLWRQLLSFLLRFLDLGGEILGVLGRALRPLRGPLMAGLGFARGFLSRFRFAAGVMERVETFAGLLFRFGDEAATAGTAATRGAAEVAEAGSERVGREAVEAGGGRALAEAAEESGERVARESVEEAGERAARESAETGAERAGVDTAETGAERAGVESADELGAGAVRAADEPGVPTVRDDALRAAEFPRAVAEAVGIEAIQDAIPNNPVSVALAALMLLKRRYRWIDTFTARPIGPGVYEIELVASPGTRIGRYTAGETINPAAEAELDELLARARAQGLEPDEATLRRLIRQDPDEFERALVQIRSTFEPELQGAAGRASRAGADIEDEIADQVLTPQERLHRAGATGEELSSTPTPGGRPQRQSTEAGNLVHARRNAEALRAELGGAPIPGQFAADAAAGDIITLDRLPDDLLAEVPLGVTSRPDRATRLVNEADAVIYELKPNTVSGINAGMEQGLRYRNLANSQSWNGRNDWRTVIVVYDAVRAREFIPR